MIKFITWVKGNIGFVLISLLILGILFNISSEVNAKTFYISPNGSDSNPGTSSKPWQTWSHALKKLNPGDTLIAKDGTWTKESSCDGSPTPCLTGTALPSIDCNAGYNNGAAGDRITVRADNERGALLKSDGNVEGLKVINCSYWDVQGLRIEGGDGSSSPRHTALVSDSSNIGLKRLLISKSNRCSNTHTLLLARTSNVVVEESEVYDFHRHGIENSQSENNTIRRNYVNSRRYGDTGCNGYKSRHPNFGDEAISAYGSSSILFENNIVEGSDWGYSVHGTYGKGSNNRFFGNIALNMKTIGSIVDSRGTTEGKKAADNTYTNHVAYNAGVGWWSRSGVNARCNNCTSLNGIGPGFIADNWMNRTDASVHWTNSLSANNAKIGFSIRDQKGWRISYANSFGNSPNYYPPSHQSLTNSTQVDPRLGGCIVYIPGGSPMKGAGEGGADIGANIIYRYVDGALTNQKLWAQGTGQFPCGATIAGVNDGATFLDSACVNVHKRLNVGVNGCPLPKIP